jgi:hypothetical protein
MVWATQRVAFVFSRYTCTRCCVWSLGATPHWWLNRMLQIGCGEQTDLQPAVRDHHCPQHSLQRPWLAPRPPPPQASA